MGLQSPDSLPTVRRDPSLSSPGVQRFNTMEVVEEEAHEWEAELGASLEREKMRQKEEQERNAQAEEGTAEWNAEVEASMEKEKARQREEREEREKKAQAELAAHERFWNRPLPKD